MIASLLNSFGCGGPKAPSQPERPKANPAARAAQSALQHAPTAVAPFPSTRVVTATPANFTLENVQTSLRQGDIAKALIQYSNAAVHTIDLLQNTSHLPLSTELLEAVIKNPSVINDGNRNVVLIIFLTVMKAASRRASDLNIDIVAQGGVTEPIRHTQATLLQYVTFGIAHLNHCAAHVRPVLNFILVKLKEFPDTLDLPAIEGLTPATHKDVIAHINPIQQKFYAKWLARTKVSLDKLEASLSQIDSTLDVLRQTQPLRLQLIHLNRGLHDLTQGYGDAPGCDPATAELYKAIELQVNACEKSLLRLEANHIGTLSTKETVSRVSQFTLPASSPGGTFWHPDNPGSCPSGRSCGFIAAYSLFREFTETTPPDIESTLYLGLARSQAVHSNELVVIECVQAAFEGILKPGEEITSIILEPGQEVDQYTKLLRNLTGGVIIRKAGSYYSIVKKPGGTIVIMDSHGFSKHQEGPKRLIGKAFRCEFNSVDSAAKFLYLRSPYSPNGEHQVTNQCEIYPFTHAITKTGLANLSADREVLTTNLFELQLNLKTQSSLQALITIVAMRKLIPETAAIELFNQHLAKLKATRWSTDLCEGIAEMRERHKSASGPRAKNRVTEEIWERYGDNAQRILDLNASH